MENFFLQATIFLGAALIAVPLAARLGLGSVLGYIAAGIVIGPILGLTGNDTAGLQHFAEFGVVVMLFLIGLELEPRTLWDMRHKLLGLGGLQVASRTIRQIRTAGMISSNDFRTGTSIELDGNVWRVVEFLHVKPGKGSAFVRTKLKAVQSGNVVEKTFRAGEMLPQAVLEKSTLQHTYMEGDDYVFMDMGSYEETRLTAKQIGESRKYLKEGMEVNVVAWNGKPLEVELPNSVVLEITQTDPGVKGDTATGGTKPAIVETGAQVMVPLFLSIGEKIKIDTRTDSYLGREN